MLILIPLEKSVNKEISIFNFKSPVPCYLTTTATKTKHKNLELKAIHFGIYNYWSVAVITKGMDLNREDF